MFMNDNGVVCDPNFLGVDRARMIATRRYVVVMIVDQELRLAPFSSL